jgi:hypothetical protein
MRATVSFMNMTANPISATDAEMSFMPAPTTAETLGAMADSINGGHEATMFAGILRQAAKELADWEWLREHHGDIDGPILVCYAEEHASLEAAINAARAG